MAEKRDNQLNVDRVDPADHTIKNAENTHRPVDREDTKLRENAAMFTPASDEGENDGPAEAEHIKGKIEATRNQMGETIDAIQDKLSFSNLSEQVSEHVNNAVETAKDAVYDATIGKAASMMKNIGEDISGSSIVKTARSNPFPFVLIGLGAGLLAYQSYAGNNKKSRRHELAPYRGRGGSAGDSTTGSHSGMLNGVTDTVSGAAGTAYETVSGAAGTAYDTVSGAAGTAYDKVTGLAETAYTGAGDAVNQAYNKVGDLKTTAVEQYDHYIEENPLAVGAVAVALGAAVGLAIPATRYEGRLMGDARQVVMDKAQDTAAGLLDKTKQVVVEAGRNITDQAKVSLTDH